MIKYIFLSGLLIGLIFVFGWVSGTNTIKHRYEQRDSNINRKFYDNETGVTCYIYKDKLMFCIHGECGSGMYSPDEFFNSHSQEKKPTPPQRNKI